MKTMEYFKGTKGEFKINSEPTGDKKYRILIYSENHKRVATCFKQESVYNSESESMANARLFVNSKNLLEAAIWAHRELSTAIGLTEWEPKIEKMMRDNLAKLEKAINDSL